MVDDMVAGRFEGGIDDVVLARADGVPAYNLAVVVDDAVQGIDQVVRGDDLLSSTHDKCICNACSVFRHLSTRMCHSSLATWEAVLQNEMGRPHFENLLNAARA